MLLRSRYRCALPPRPREVLLQRFTVQGQFVLHHQTGERQTRLPGNGAKIRGGFVRVAGTLTGSLFVKPKCSHRR